MTTESEIISACVSGHNIFILGQAGTGKSYLIRKLHGILTERGLHVEVAATTALASSRLRKETTIHHLFGLLDDLEKLKRKINQDDSYRKIRDIIISTDTIIVDEISMLSRIIFETVEGLCRFTRKCDQPFGGIQFIIFFFLLHV